MRVEVIEYGVTILLQNISKLGELPKIRRENNQVVRPITLLGEITYNLPDHFYLIRILFRRRRTSITSVRYTGIIILAMPMVNENEVVLDTTNVGATLGLGSIGEVGVCECPDKP